MKTLYILILSASLACISISKLHAQAPGGVPNPTVWYRADASVYSDAGTTAAADNAPVYQWNDYLGSGRNLLQTTAARRPVYSNTTTLANFNPTLTFTRANTHWMQCDPGTGNEIINRASGTFYSAGYMDSDFLGTTTGAGIIGFNTDMDYPGLHTSNNSQFNLLMYAENGANYTPISTNAFTYKNSFVAGSSWQNGASTTSPATYGATTVSLNGTHTFYSGNNFLNVNTVNTARQFRIGGDTDWGSYNGQLNEVLIYQNILTSQEKNRLESYLAIKYGTTLSGNYVNSTSGIVWNSDPLYQNNVLGIARDNNGALYQKQSRSENKNQKLIIGAGNGLFNTNAANTNTLTDGQFLIVGDNGLKQALSIPLVYTAGTNGQTNFRFESIWKVQNTGSVGTVTVAWPKGVNNLYLVQSTDAVFNGSDSFTPMTAEVTVNGVVYNTATITLSNGSFFTFAGFEYAPGGVTGVDFWVKSDDAGAIATAWKDHSINTDNIPNVGGITLSAADRNHNFHPYTTGYTTSKFFYNTVSLMNPTNGELANTNTSIFSAVRPAAATGTGRITGIDDDATNAAEPGMSILSGLPRQYEWYNTTTETSFSTTFNNGSSNIFSAIADNSVANGGTSASTGGEKRLGLNGTYETTSFTGTNKFQIYGRHLRVGHGTWDANGAFPGDIMEVIWYKRTLTANEQSRVNSYLALKNGVTSAENYLTSNSNIVWDIIVNNGYNNNIFGIARDNASALNQKQATSTGANQQLVIGHGNSLSESNADNTNDLTDGQFLIVGDNGLKQSLSTPLVSAAGANGETNYRFESIWKTQNTGNIGTVTVAWPKGVKNLYLVQSPDAVFDATDTFTPMAAEVTVNGVVYNTANVMLSNGQYFTFAGFGYSPGGVVNGLAYWYRADKNAANTGDGTDVTGWTDVWNGTTVAQLGTNALPKYTKGTSSYFNFNPGINFTAVTQTLGNVNVRTISALEFDIFTLTKENILGTGANNRIFSSLVDNSLPSGAIERWDGIGLMTDQGYANQVERVNNSYGARYLANPGNISRSTTIPSIMYHRFTDLTISKGLNGAANGTNGTHTARGLMNGGHAFGDTRFSGNGSDNGGFTGNIGETIIYGAGNLTATERRRVDSYLGIKYGITLGQVNTDHYLDADGNMVWNGATNTAYNNNIFGIAREDIGLFEQKVSKSVNAGTILTVATTNDFVNPNDNAARTGFAQDKTYLLLGDNNVTLLPLNSITVNGFTGGARIQRQWLAQPTNAVGTVNFGADLSAYGAGFIGGAAVKMMVANDAAFTSNVEYIAGTYDATSGKWVHPYSFSSGQNKYITYVRVDENACTAGCNDNTFLNTTDPNDIEYDNLIAGDEDIIAKGKDGAFYIWGYNTSPNVSTANTNVVLDLLTPTKIDPSTVLPTTGSTGSGFNYTGTPLKAAIANVYHLLTTDGLYVWGNGNMYTLTTINNTAITYRTPSGYRFGKLTVNNKADGLPPGVSPSNVKMMFGAQLSLTIVTCSGEVWTLNQGPAYFGDGVTTSSPANNSIWHRVKTSATQTLDNVVAVRGNDDTKIALTSTGKLYTWGQGTYIGDGTDLVGGTNRAFATEMVVPAGVTPKMIGITGITNYFLLATNGKLYAMGSNDWGVLGDGTENASITWKEVTAISGAHTLGGNIVWISPGEHSAFSDSYPTINVLTNDKKQWGWGSNFNYKLGQADASGTTIYANPIYMPGNSTNPNPMGLNDEIIAVETGGRFTMNYKSTNTYFGFVGLSQYGTIGNGSTGNASFEKYTYNTAILDLCSAVTGSCTNPGVFDAAGLPSTTGISNLVGFTGATTGWPANVNNGHIVIESKNKGFVITRVSSSAAILNPVEGMLIYDMAAACVKLYNGTDWKCLAKDCL